MKIGRITVNTLHLIIAIAVFALAMFVGHSDWRTALFITAASVLVLGYVGV